MKKRLIAPLVAITIGFYSVLDVLFNGADEWWVSLQVIAGLALVIVGLCVWDHALNTIKAEEALKKAADDKAQKAELARKVAEIEREWKA